jgi:hypothetical protein
VLFTCNFLFIYELESIVCYFVYACRETFEKPIFVDVVCEYKSTLPAMFLLLFPPVGGLVGCSLTRRRDVGIPPCNDLGATCYFLQWNLAITDVSNRVYFVHVVGNVTRGSASKNICNAT